MNKTINAILIGIVCFILTFSIFLQIKTIRNTELITNRTSSNTNLRDNAIKWQEKYYEIISDLEKAEIILKDIRNQSLQNNPEAVEKEKELLKNYILMGTTDVSGTGVIITLQDSEFATNKNISITDDIKNYLVHDSNLREVIRNLKVSGAEAISVNDQRVISTTSIVCSGNVIRVNDEKVGSPFTIKAIGSKELLYGNLQDTIKNLNKLGITVNIEKSDNIDIGKYSGTIRYDYIRSTE